MTEYIIVSIFFGLFVWYAIVGGSGGWEKTEVTPGTGAYVDIYTTNSVAAPGLVPAINKKQKEFSDSIYEP